MKHKILEHITKYLEKHPDQRFGQALFNLGINEFDENSNLRDIHNDSDEKIILRIENQLSWFALQQKVNSTKLRFEELKGMTVNERLWYTDLIKDFEIAMNSNKESARYILKSIFIDEESISLILKSSKI